METTEVTGLGQTYVNVKANPIRDQTIQEFEAAADGHLTCTQKVSELLSSLDAVQRRYDARKGEINGIIASNPAYTNETKRKAAMDEEESKDALLSELRDTINKYKSDKAEWESSLLCYELRMKLYTNLARNTPS